MLKNLSIAILLISFSVALAQAPDDATVTAAGDACMQHFNKILSQGRWMPGWENCETIMVAYNNTKKKLAEQQRLKAEQDALDAVNALAGKLKP